MYLFILEVPDSFKKDGRSSIKLSDIDSCEYIGKSLVTSNNVV